MEIKKYIQKIRGRLFPKRYIDLENKQFFEEQGDNPALFLKWKIGNQ